MTSRTIFGTGMICAAIWVLTGVSPRAQAFDAVSIKPNDSGAASRSFRLANGQLSATNVTARHVMWNAYGLQDFQIIGGPNWLATERFDILAKAEGNPGPEQMRAMLRQLLAEHFKLTAHSDSRELPIYALVVARTDGRLGDKLRPAEPCPSSGACGGFSVGNGSMSARNATLARLAGELTGFVGRRVVDRSGLTGSYALALEWSESDAGPSLFTAVQEQLGLKLEPARGPVDVLIIDGAARPAGSNAQAEPNASGKWQGTTGNGASVVLELKAAGTSLTGTLTRGDQAASVTDGTVTRTVLKFKVTLDGMARAFTAELAGDRLTVTLDDRGPGSAVVLERMKLTPPP